MNITSVLARLKAHQIEVQVDFTNSEGWRILIAGCPAPSPPFAAGRYLYSTIVLAPGEEDLSLEEREAVRRRLWHGTTDIFGDDAVGLTELEHEDIEDLLASAPPPPNEVL